jgi:hypothetical protein
MVADLARARVQLVGRSLVEHGSLRCPNPTLTPGKAKALASGQTRSCRYVHNASGTMTKSGYLSDADHHLIASRVSIVFLSFCLPPALPVAAKP